MTPFARTLIVSAVLAIVAPPATAVDATAGKTDADLSSYAVTDPEAGYFDRTGRKEFLQATTDPVLTRLMEELQLGVSCRDIRERPPITGEIVLAGFYQDRETWRRNVAPFLAFEDAVSHLAAAQFVADDRRHGDCLLDLLVEWAGAEAFEDFVVTSGGRQIWYQLESTLFAVTLALSVVRPDLRDRADDLAAVDAWLLRLARRHLAVNAGPTDCCNNHMYRRAVYAAMLGVQTGEDDLFRFAVGALFSAVANSTPEGALPLEMARGPLAAHYQNFAAMYLALVAQIVERQGHSAFDLRFGDRSLAAIFDFSISAGLDPDVVRPFVPASTQEMRYLADDQYLSWLEILAARGEADPRIETQLEPHRPAYNRSAGGFMTLYFHEP